MAMSCGGCGKIFSGQTLFDQHRIGGYGEPIYAEKDLDKNPKDRRPLAYGKHTRHCMTTEEMLAAGYQFERKEVTITIEGQGHREERDIWFDPIAREVARAAFRKEESEE